MNDQPVVSVNGILRRADEAHINARDRGFTLGDGLFETMRAHGGRILNIHLHLSRLRAGARVLGLDIPWSDADFEAEVYRALEANGLREATVRLSVSRGVARTRGLLPDSEAFLTIAIDAQPFPGYPYALYSRGMRAITSSIRRNESSPLAQVKTLNYLDNVLARREAASAGADEALMRNNTGNLACASAANLFLLIGGILVTPDVRSGALPGTVRALVFSHLAPDAHVRVEERPVRPSEVGEASEAFLTNALLGVMPLTSLDGHPIGTGRPGPYTARIGSSLAILSAAAE